MTMHRHAIETRDYFAQKLVAYYLSRDQHAYMPLLITLARREFQWWQTRVDAHARGVL